MRAPYVIRYRIGERGLNALAAAGKRVFLISRLEEGWLRYFIVVADTQAEAEAHVDTL